MTVVAVCCLRLGFRVWLYCGFGFLTCALLLVCVWFWAVVGMAGATVVGLGFWFGLACVGLAGVCCEFLWITLCCGLVCYRFWVLRLDCGFVVLWLACCASGAVWCI